MRAEVPGGATATTLLSFCPRQILLRNQSAMAKSKSSDNNALKPCKTRTTEESLNQKMKSLFLRRSIAAYLHKFGYLNTLSAFQSEVKIDDWNSAQSLDLELIFNKHLEISENPSEAIIIKLSNQGPRKNVIAKQEPRHDANAHQGKCKDEDLETESKKTDFGRGEAEELHENLEEKKKKKKSKVCSKYPADSIQQLSQLVVHESEVDKLNLKPRDKKNKKNKKQEIIVDSDENVVQAASEEKLKCEQSKSEPQVTEFADERDAQSKNKKKRKHKSLPDADMMDSLIECLVANDENGMDPKLGETVVKSKEKKKEKQKSVPDSDISDPKKRDHENSLGIDDQTDTKSKDKKKKKHKLRHVSEQTIPMNGGDENGVVIEKKESKKRKRLASAEGVPTVDHILAEDVKVTKKEAFEEKKVPEVVLKEKDALSGGDLNDSKKRKLEKSEEGSIKTNGTAPDTKNKDGLSEDDGSEKVEANVSKSGFSQKTMKREHNGSAEPKTVNAFRRVKADEIKFADERLQDNSYWAKDGADIGYGAKAQEILGQVRGRDFRHEKTKKKRGSYRGGQIDLHSHSIKFNYSDDE